VTDGQTDRRTDRQTDRQKSPGGAISGKCKKIKKKHSDVSVLENDDEAETYDTQREDSDGTKARSSVVKRKTGSATDGKYKKIKQNNPETSTKAVIKRGEVVTAFHQVLWSQPTARCYLF